MSTYMGTGSSGKKQIHLTNTNFSLGTMQGGPRQGTTFHSDLPYITVLDTIHSYESSSRRNLAKSYMDQGYVYKHVYRSYSRGGESWMPGSTAVFKMNVATNQHTNFLSRTEINPARGHYGGRYCYGPPEAWNVGQVGTNTDGAFLVVDAINYYMNLTAGYSGGYTQGTVNNNVELRSPDSSRAYQGSATIRGTDPLYTTLNTQHSRYNPWTGSKTNGSHNDVLILNVKKNSSGYQYTNQNNDPGSSGILINRNDITVGSNYSMRNTPILADLGGSTGTVGWNSSQGKYFLNVPYMRNSWPLPNSTLWNFLNDVYKVGTTFTSEMDEVSHIVSDLWIFVNDSNTIVGWQAKPGLDHCLMNIHPAKLLGTSSGVEVTDDTIKMYGTNGKQLTVASPSTDLLQVPEDPTVVTAAAISNYKYSQIRSGMSVKQTYTAPNDTWVNRGSAQRLYHKSELVGTASFPPSLRGNVDSARVMIDFKWGSGSLRVSEGGYTSSHTIDHKVVHSPMVVEHLFRTPGELQQIGGDLFYHVFSTTELNVYNVGASQQPTNDSNNRFEGVSVAYRLYADWDNERFVIYRTWEGCSGNFYWSYYSYNQTIYSRVYAYSDGACRYYIPECKISIYPLSATDNDYTITPK